MLRKRYSQKINTIRKKFPREWLLIAIDKMDSVTTTPLMGHLLAHSPRRNEIYDREMACNGHTLTVYSEDGFPKGYAAAFYEIQ